MTRDYRWSVIILHENGWRLIFLQIFINRPEQACLASVCGVGQNDFPRPMISHLLGSDPWGWGPSQGCCRPSRAHARSQTKVQKSLKEHPLAHVGVWLWPGCVAVAGGPPAAGWGGVGAQEGRGPDRRPPCTGRSHLDGRPCSVLGGVEKTCGISYIKTIFVSRVEN